MPGERIVHVVDDDEAVRQSLAFLLGSAGLAVRLYESAIAFLDAAPQAQSGCLITDLRMPDINGIELLRRLRSSGCDLPAIVISGHGDVPMAVQAMKAGAIDFIEKPFDDETLLRAIDNALSRTGPRRPADETRAEFAARIASLSARERQVLEGLVGGRANKAIAFDLGISPRTVEVYRANVMTKMQARSLSDLVRMALQADLATSPSDRSGAD